jgi:hypothetical protein
MVIQREHGAHGARHRRAVARRLPLPPRQLVGVMQVAAGESQLKPLAPHAPDGLMHRTSCGAAMLRIAHMPSVSARKYATEAHHPCAETLFGAATLQVAAKVKIASIYEGGK